MLNRNNDVTLINITNETNIETSTHEGNINGNVVTETPLVNAGKKDFESVANVTFSYHPLLLGETLCMIASHLNDDLKQILNLALVCKFTHDVLKDTLAREKNAFFRGISSEINHKDLKPYQDIANFRRDVLALEHLAANDASNKRYLFTVLNEITSVNKLRLLKQNPSVELTGLINKAMKLRSQLESQLPDEGLDNRLKDCKCNIL